MTKNDVIRMARESGIELYGLGRDRENFLCILESFTKLVAAHERKRLKEEMAPSGSFVLWNNTKCNALADALTQSKSAWDDGYASGVAAERKACAKVCDMLWNAAECAEAIRARSNP
jgi:hypothetical protein